MYSINLHKTLHEKYDLLLFNTSPDFSSFQAKYPVHAFSQFLLNEMDGELDASEKFRFAEASQKNRQTGKNGVFLLLPFQISYF